MQYKTSMPNPKMWHDPLNATHVVLGAAVAVATGSDLLKPSEPAEH